MKKSIDSRGGEIIRSIIGVRHERLAARLLAQAIGSVPPMM